MRNVFKIAVSSCVIVCLISGLIGCSNEQEGFSSSVVIKEFSPVKGLEQTEVTIKGSGFNEDARVFFNETEATDYTSRTGDEIIVKVPSGSRSGKIGIIVGEDSGFSVDSFKVFPPAVLEGYSYAQAPVGTKMQIYGKNFFEVDPSEVEVTFGTVTTKATSLTPTEINVTVPEGATSGPIIVNFVGMQIMTGPEFNIGEIIKDVPDYQFDLTKLVKADGSYQVQENLIESTKKGSYLIYPVTISQSGYYNISLQASTDKANASINVDMGTEVASLANRAVNNSLSQDIVKEGWSSFKDHTYGAFKLKGGLTYYVKVTFLTPGSDWVANVKNMILKFPKDQPGSGIEVK